MPTIAPANWNDDHAAPSWMCLTADPAAVARANPKARLREEATAARVSNEEYLPHQVGDGGHYGEVVLPHRGGGSGGVRTPKLAARLVQSVAQDEPREPWQPSCETCSPLVAPACRKICPDIGLVNEILEGWRSA